MKKNLVESSLKDARFLKIKEKTFDHLGSERTFEKLYMYGNLVGVTVRLEFDRWAEFLEKDFDMLGITCWKIKEQEPITFSTTVEKYSTRDIHGMIHFVRDSVCVVLPRDCAKFLGEEVEVTVKFK